MIRRGSFTARSRARFLEVLPEGSPGNLRAQDIFEMVKPKDRRDVLE